MMYLDVMNGKRHPPQSSSFCHCFLRSEWGFTWDHCPCADSFSGEPLNKKIMDDTGNLGSHIEGAFSVFSCFIRWSNSRTVKVLKNKEKMCCWGIFCHFLGPSLCVIVCYWHIVRQATRMQHIWQTMESKTSIALKVWTYYTEKCRMILMILLLILLLK